MMKASFNNLEGGSVPDVPTGHNVNSRGRKPTEDGRNGCSTPQGSHFYQHLDRGLPPTAIHIRPLRGLKGAAASRFSPAGLPSNLKLKTSNSSERGVALIITLIFLAIITFMAVTFLVLSRHASEAVTTVTQQAISQQAAQSAVEQAEANIVATMTARGEGFDFGPVISQTYQSATGFTNNVALNPANVSYFDTAGNLLDYRSTAYLQMLNNLLVKPRPPVVIATNANFPPDFRFYLDLNQNGLFDPSEPITVENQFKQFEPNAAGDPEWIGILEHPDQPHSRSNQFVARYAFFAQPIGNSLDLNFIHNQAKQIAFNEDGFLRNQGVGSWEINLAGFLYGLNPFVWTYGNGQAGINYVGLDTNTPPVNPYFPSRGTAFEDAAEILQVRYNPFYGNLPSLLAVYPGITQTLAPTMIDYYAQGPLMGGENPSYLLNQNINRSWSGNGNLNPYFTTQDPLTLAPAALPAGNFPGHLANATAGITPGFQVPDGNFNRYTYYRMLSQMGMDSAPEPETKLNLNYINVGGYAASNFVPWTGDSNGMIEFPLGSGIQESAALVFFTNAANRLLGTQTNFIIPYPVTGGPGTRFANYMTNISTAYIPIYPTNYYTPSVNRLLQLAANIYDAANPKTNGGFDYPSVFRPIFGEDFSGVNVRGQKITNIFIRGYVLVTNADYLLPYVSMTNFPAMYTNAIARFVKTNGVFVNIGGEGLNVYGIPWIIGAKKGLPNFNQISMESYTALTRKLQIVKPFVGSDRATWHTNVQYILSLSNTLMAEAWNSYIQSYPRGVDILGTDTFNMVITNEFGVITPTNFYNTNVSISFALPTIPANTWAGTGVNISSNIAGSFRVPLLSPVITLPGDIYSTNNPNPKGTFIYTPNPISAGFQTTTGYPLPRFGLVMTNRFEMTMVDHATGRVIDHVQLEGMGGQRDLTGAGELEAGDDWGPGGVWDTNRMTIGSSDPNMSMYGIENQISASQQPPPYTSPGWTTPVSAADWNQAVLQTMGFNSVSAAASSFNAFFNNNTNVNSFQVMQVPFTPTRSVCVYYTWQANDPLVHYTIPDLTDLINSSNGIVTNWTFTNLIVGKLGQINQRYNPWGGSINGGNADYNNNLTLMDPLQTNSDAWQFPTNKLPGIGWLGRVHRGSPWQTVYMKSPPVDPNLWFKWTGNNLFFPGTNFISDSLISSPINDWAIFDLFTTAPNDNATRGQLSVNQINYAAWAAMLDGVIVLTNSSTAGFQPIVIDPNSPNGEVDTIYNSIQNARINTNRYGGLQNITTPGGVFTRVGDILAAPALSITSPFLDIGDPVNPTQPNDIAYEWLPQQIMSLLRVGQPRYVIYAYGQSLKPAQNSVVSGGQFYGTVTNYQITGEMETRTVVRFEPVTPPNPKDLYTPLNPTQNPLMPQLFPNNIQPLAPSFQAIFPPRPQVRAVIESYSVLPPE